MEIVLSKSEQAMLVGLLEAAVGDVRSGVRRTHAPGWHDGLKAEEALLKGLLEKLRTS